MRRLLGLFALLIPLMALAAVYKYRDESGNLVFSDRPHPGAERVKIDLLQTYQTNGGGKASTKSSSRGKDAPDGEEQKEANSSQYTDISIISPGPGEAVRDNAGNVTISVIVVPALMADDNVIILMDGQPVAGPGKVLTAALKEVTRGEHHVEAQILDASGNVQKSTNSIFYLLRTSVKRILGSAAESQPSLIRRVLSFLTS
jgi:hypothetical protein